MDCQFISGYFVTSLSVKFSHADINIDTIIYTSDTGFLFTRIGSNMYNFVRYASFWATRKKE